MVPMFIRLVTTAAIVLIMLLVGTVAIGMGILVSRALVGPEAMVVGGTAMVVDGGMLVGVAVVDGAAVMVGVVVVVGAAAVTVVVDNILLYAPLLNSTFLRGGSV